MLVDDHTLIRQCCRQAFESAGYSVVAEAGSGEEAVLMYSRVKPGVVVMDLWMKNMGGLEAIERIRARDPHARILVLSMHDEPTIAARALRAGASGYLTKMTDADRLIEGVRRVAAGNAYLCSEVATSLAVADLSSRDNPLGHLSPREFEVLRLILDGGSTAKIADSLSLSHKTVTNCQIRIKQKLGVKSLAELIKLAINCGINKRNVLLG